MCSWLEGPGPHPGSEDKCSQGKLFLSSLSPLLIGDGSSGVLEQNGRLGFFFR